MNSKSTKKKLTGSIWALVVCFILLLGTTFAWFTDTASTNVNKIQAGELDVALEMQNAQGEWVSAEQNEDGTPVTLNFVKSADALEGEEVLWEPGCTYDLPDLRVKNNGNLALKYKVEVAAVSGDEELAEVIDVLFLEQKQEGNGTSQPVGTLEELLNSTEEDGVAHGKLIAGATTGEIKISLHMQETAGNEYQGKAIDGIRVTVLATQDTVEFDSNDNQYDKDAGYVVDVYTIEDLRAAVASNSGAKIVLNDDIIIGDDELEVVDAVKNAKGMLLVNRDIVIDLNGKTLAYTGGTKDNCWYIFYVKNAELTIIDSSGDNSGMVYGNDPDGTWAVMIREKIGGTVNIYGGHFKSCDGAAVYTNDGDVNIYGGIFETEKTAEQLLYMGNYTGSMRVYGGSFKNFNPDNAKRNIKLADGYKSVQEDVWYNVVPE